MGIPLSEVCAVGDFDNNIPMLEKAGYPVTMGNAGEKVRRTAAFVTKTNQEDGVAALLYRLMKENYEKG